MSIKWGSLAKNGFPEAVKLPLTTQLLLARPRPNTSRTRSKCRHVAAAQLSSDPVPLAEDAAPMAWSRGSTVASDSKGDGGGAGAAGDWDDDDCEGVVDAGGKSWSERTVGKCSVSNGGINSSSRAS